MCVWMYNCCILMLLSPWIPLSKKKRNFPLSWALLCGTANSCQFALKFPNSCFLLSSKIAVFEHSKICMSNGFLVKLTEKRTLERNLNTVMMILCTKILLLWVHRRHLNEKLGLLFLKCCKGSTYVYVCYGNDFWTNLTYGK